MEMQANDDKLDCHKPMFHQLVTETVDRMLTDCPANSRVGLEWLKSKLDDISAIRRRRTSEEENRINNEWLEWASSHPKLKIVGVDVPRGILPDGVRGRLQDVKVFSRHGPDDAIYDNVVIIRNRVARGNCFLQLSAPNMPQETMCVVHALKKFTGGLGDDDDQETDDEFTWKRYFIKPIECAQTVVCTPKMNGEAAHLGACRIKQEYYICAGSKNVHLLFRNHADLNLYNLRDSRYTIAAEVCNCVLSMLSELSVGQREGLLEFLVESRSMAVFEMLSPDHQHVEDLSYLTSAKLKFIAWTSCIVQCDSNEASEVPLCQLPPDSGIELAKVFGLDAISYTLIDITQIDSHMSSIRNQHGIEGEVLFILDENRSTIGMLKKKTVWYIIVRALREKLRAACNKRAKDGDISIAGEHARIHKRLGEIQKWLHLDSTTVQAWENVGVAFLTWCKEKLDAGVFDATQLNNLYPVYWKQFLQETNCTDKIAVITT